MKYVNPYIFGGHKCLQTWNVKVLFEYCIFLYETFKWKVISLTKVKGFETLRLFFFPKKKNQRKVKKNAFIWYSPKLHSWLLIGNIWGWAWQIVIKLKLPIHTLPFWGYFVFTVFKSKPNGLSFELWSQTKDLYEILLSRILCKYFVKWGGFHEHLRTG